MKPVTFLAASLLASVLCAAPPALADLLHIAYLGPWEAPFNPIEHIYWNGNGWTFEQVSRPAGAPDAGVGSNLVGYFQRIDTPAGPDTWQHIFYVDSLNHLHELWQNYNPVFGFSNWGHTDIFQAAGTIVNPAPSTALAGYAVANSEHVFYIGDDSHVHEFRSDDEFKWRHNDLNQLQLGAPNSASSGPLLAYALIGQGVIGQPEVISHNVFYVAVDSHIWWLNGIERNGQVVWYAGDISSYAASSSGGVTVPNPAAASPLSSQATMWCVSYVGVDGHVHFISIYGGWKHLDLTQAAIKNSGASFSNPVAGSALAAYHNLSSDTKHFVYIGDDTDVHELQLNPDGSVIHKDLSSYSGSAPGMAVSTVLGATSMQLDGQNPSERVIYLHQDHLEDLAWDTSTCSSCWQDEDLTSAAGAMVSTGSGVATYVGAWW